jgi:glycosyltransferase involved in cell wall biosynthesis
MKKVAIVVQRYGLAVNGGAEYHARILAEQLKTLYDIEILTSCAKDYHTWANEYDPGVTDIDGVIVRRFRVAHKRNKAKVHRLLKKLNNRTFTQQLLRRLGLSKLFEKLFLKENHVQALGEEWSKQQGPYTPDLISYLEENEVLFDAIIFFTYLYYPTFMGMRVAPNKSILIPTAHDEPAIHLPIFKSFFHLPRAILYNTISEKKLVCSLFSNDDVYNDIVGVGISQIKGMDIKLASKVLGSNTSYLIYIGRIDPGKGTDILFEYFLKYKAAYARPLKLVLIGQLLSQIPEHEDIQYLGFVDEQLKVTMMKSACALVMPSVHESLSLVTLESLLNGVPVIVTARSEVLVDHVLKSGAGFIFNDFASFASAVDNVLNESNQLSLMRERAVEYVHANYGWELVLQKFKKAIDYVAK